MKASKQYSKQTAMPEIQLTANLANDRQSNMM